ncbi:hypothetical protein [Mesorhizobium sp. BR1-1-14]|uniref:hypothetical protein n=1 Tax=Mesorhizobium sp. BR1-1-14 TaxID=2876655 RepID=UPI000DD9F72B|nr:hypothetical protein [Mesorhizobium sp. BR1-1-14]MBZ9959025.1 hypothetical protein [Mesorhizobium sp. BR1-1-14]
MSKKLEPTDLDEPAELSFGERPSPGKLVAMEMKPFDRLSAALRYAMEDLEEKHRGRCMITTKSGSVYRWDVIPELYEHVRIAGAR